MYLNDYNNSQLIFYPPPSLVKYIELLTDKLSVCYIYTICKLYID